MISDTHGDCFIHISFGHLCLHLSYHHLHIFARYNLIQLAGTTIFPLGIHLLQGQFKVFVHIWMWTIMEWLYLLFTGHES